MESLLVVTGPPGAGKSTLASVLADRLDLSVLIEGDAFFRFLRNGAIDPWLPGADRQNAVVTRAAGAAAGAYARGGLRGVYDGVVGPWFLDEFLAATGLESLDYVMLLPPVDTCVARVLTRQNHGFTDEAAARRMHAQFARSSIPARHVIQEATGSCAALADQILAARMHGDLVYPSAEPDGRARPA